MTQVVDPTMKVRPSSGRIMELGKRTIWLAMESAHTPLSGTPLLTKYGRQSTEGYAHGIDESVEVREI
jgi:hypothetical protein